MSRRAKQIILFSALCVVNIIIYCLLTFWVNDIPPVGAVYTYPTEETYDGGINVTLKRSKDWPESGFRRGVQYDIVIINNSPHQIADWTVRVDMPEKSELSETWNMDYEIEGDTLVARPVEYNDTVEQNTVQPIGFIVICHEVVDIPGLYIEYTPVYQYRDFTLFWVNLFFSLVIIVAAIITIIVEIKTYSLSKQNKINKHIILQTMKICSNSIDAKDPYTMGHSSRVAYYSRELAKKLGMSSKEVEQIYYIGFLHDVGKILISDDILNKPGLLTSEERTIIETHTVKGGEILKDFDTIEGIADGARYHHEHYNGNGYPTGLKGEDIPFIARIICVADSYDAMSSDRCYRPRLDNDTIIKELEENKGEQFDPKVVDAMLELIKSTNFFKNMEEA